MVDRRGNMQNKRLLFNIYAEAERALSSLGGMLSNDVADLDANIDVSLTDGNWVNVEIEGEDEEFALNFLIQKYGFPVENVVSGQICKGNISSISTGGVTVNVGIDVTVDRGQLKVLGAGDVSQITSRFGMILHQPVEIEVIEVKDNPVARFTKAQVDTWWEWKKAPTDRLLVNSTTRSHLKDAIKRTGHGRDIYGIERLGLLENMIICREDTDAPGLVSEIGPRISGEIGVIIGAH